MKIENIQVFNFNNAFRGMRNPKNSWSQSDSVFGLFSEDKAYDIVDNAINQYYEESDLENMTEQEYENLWSYFNHNIIINGNWDDDIYECAAIGPKDLALAQNLIKAGPEHRKFLRQIFVTADITAPLYW